MEITTFCLFAFCVNTLSNNEFENFDIEMQLDNLSYKADLNHRHLTYLVRVTNFNVKLQVEDEIRKQLVVPGYVALRALHAQAGAALKANKDAEGTCYSDNKQNIINAVRNAFFSLEPCIADLEVGYVELYSDTASAKAIADKLAAEVDRLRSLCSGLEGNVQENCYDTGIAELSTMIKDSQSGHNNLYAKYYDVVGLVPDALECVRKGGAALNQELQNIQKLFPNCYAPSGTK